VASISGPVWLAWSAIAWSVCPYRPHPLLLLPSLAYSQATPFRLHDCGVHNHGDRAPARPPLPPLLTLAWVLAFKPSEPRRHQSCTSRPLPPRAAAPTTAEKAAGLENTETSPHSLRRQLLQVPKMGTTERSVGAGIYSASDSHTGVDFEAKFSGSPALSCPTDKHSSKSEPSSQKVRREDQPMSLSPEALELRCL
jgi:hypothetical protein